MHIPRCSSLFVIVVVAGCMNGQPSQPPSQPVDRVCAATQQALAPVAFTWSGSTDTCQPGSPPDALARATIDRTNLVRAAVGVSPVRQIDGVDAQRCALVLTANDSVAHVAEPEWSCLDPDPTSVLARSLTSDRLGLDLFQAYMIDPRNHETLGHRRWLLSPWLDGIGIGATDDKACVDLLVDGTSSIEGWIAWPPPGDTPLALLELEQFSTDEEGWMVMSDTLAFDGARVHITLPNRVIETETNVLAAGFGSAHALRFVPRDPVPVDVEWTVVVDGLEAPLTYSGRKVDCDKDTP